MQDGAPRVKAVETNFGIIQALRDNGGAGVSEIAREVGRSKSAVYKHVQTLTRLGYLVQNGDDYYLSLRFLGLGTRAGDRLPLDVARPVVADLSETTGHATNFIVHENDHGVYALCSESGDGSAPRFLEGDVAPLHATAGGKAILSFLPADERDAIYRSTGLPAHTERTITDPAELNDELRSIRDHRIAFDRQEYHEEYQCVASPIVGTDGRAVGAVSVTGNSDQMSGKHLEEDVTGLVVSASKSIERDLLSS